MANMCDSSFKIQGPREALDNLWNTLQELKVNEKNVWLGELARHYGIDPEEKQCSVRGDIYLAEYEQEHGIISLDTESAWCANVAFFEELNHVFGDELSISFREVECGCEVFYVHDEGGFFPEECLVDCSGDQFHENGEIIVDTIEDAIEEWCRAMSIKQGDRSQEEMVKFINDYEYEDEDTYYYIHPFVFDGR